jgi:hypothetical protein
MAEHLRINRAAPVSGEKTKGLNKFTRPAFARSTHVSSNTSDPNGLLSYPVSERLPQYHSPEPVQFSSATIGSYPVQCEDEPEWSGLDRDFYEGDHHAARAARQVPGLGMLYSGGRSGHRLGKKWAKAVAARAPEVPHQVTPSHPPVPLPVPVPGAAMARGAAATGRYIGIGAAYMAGGVVGGATGMALGARHAGERAKGLTSSGVAKAMDTPHKGLELYRHFRGHAAGERAEGGGGAFAQMAAAGEGIELAGAGYEGVEGMHQMYTGVRDHFTKKREGESENDFAIRKALAGRRMKRGAGSTIKGGLEIAKAVATSTPGVGIAASSIGAAVDIRRGFSAFRRWRNLKKAAGRLKDDRHKEFAKYGQKKNRRSLMRKIGGVTGAGLGIAAAAVGATPVGWGLAAGAGVVGLGLGAYKLGRWMHKRWKVARHASGEGRKKGGFGSTMKKFFLGGSRGNLEKDAATAGFDRPEDLEKFNKRKYHSQWLAQQARAHPQDKQTKLLLDQLNLGKKRRILHLGDEDQAADVIAHKLRSDK